ncbi:MAG: IPT/TIG domain-containing protein, partial [Bdellovibrionota bacterium]
MTSSIKIMAAPTLTAPSPNYSAIEGGATITLTGTGFIDGVTVTIGGNACTSVTVSSETTLTCKSAAHAAGLVDIVLTNPDTQAATLASQFFFGLPPTVTAVSPSAGALAGGGTLTLTGSNFITGATVSVGGISCTSPAIISTTSMTCTLGAATAAVTGSVVVTNPDTQTSTLASAFSYRGPPTITSVSPSTWVTIGGTAITIAGTGFMAGAVATLDSTACTSVTVASATQITCTTAAHTSGAVTVAVTNTEAQSGTLDNAFSYSTIIGVATAWTSSWVMYANGSLKYWGNGYYYGGQTAITPLEFITSGVTSISCVGYSDGCCAVISGGVKCWGVNQYKNIGDGGSSNSATPVTATGLTSGVSAIRAGAYSVCANLSNGTAKCWGSNSSGHLG